MSLLDDEGDITAEFEQCLKAIFSKYCSPASSDGVLAHQAAMSSDALDTWARDTNGLPLPQEQKDELLECMDVTDDGALTFKGFLQLYQLQTESDPEETWKDLVCVSSSAAPG